MPPLPRTRSSRNRSATTRPGARSKRVPFARRLHRTAGGRRARSTGPARRLGSTPGLHRVHLPCNLGASMHITVAPECLRFYALLPQGARRAADQLLQDLAVDPAHPSILYEPLAETPDPRLRQVRLSKRFGAILWFGDGGEGARLMWVGPRDETSVRDALGRMAPFREGAA